MFADLATHIDWVRSSFLEKVTDLSPFRALPDVHVVIEKGLLSDTATRWSGETLSIGAGEGCDVQLPDKDVAGVHAKVQFRRSVFGQLAEIAALEKVQIDGGVAIAAGSTSALLRLPVRLALGDASLSISSNPEEGWSGALSKRSIALATLVLAGSAAIFIAVNQIVREAQITTIAAAVQHVPQQTATPRPDSLRHAETQLGGLGLAQALSISAGADGSLLVEGSLPAAQQANWEAFRAWYDQQPAMPVLTSAVTPAPKLVALRPITYVQLHEPATVFFAEGDPASIGDVLEEGWTLTAIDVDGLTLQRATETTRIHF